MKPTSSRAARRLAKKTAKGAPLTIADLAQRVERAKVSGIDKALQERAKRILTSYLQTAHDHVMPIKDVVAEMASGQTAWRLGSAIRDEILKTPPEAVQNAACKQGCAFCCILTDDEGGVITAFEAAQLHEAAKHLQGKADGRDWHAKACPALDPETRSCRAYDARPMICRSFLSTDAGACRANAEGGTEKGAGLLGNHLDYLVVHALCRQALKGIALVPTYSLAAVAGGAVAGQDVLDNLTQAHHKTSALERAYRDAAKAAKA